MSVVEHVTGVELVGKIEELVDTLSRAMQLGEEVGWVFGQDNFDEQAKDRMDTLPLGPSLRSALWEVLCNQWGSDSLTEGGWLSVPKEIEDTRAVLALVRRRVEEEARAKA